MMRLPSNRAIAAPILALALSSCFPTPGPMVAPLRYQPTPVAVDEPFRARPPVSSPAPPGLALPFEITSLPGGLTVVHVQRSGLPSVSIRLVMTRGRADVWAPLDTASILEEILSTGTQNRLSAQLAQAYAELGATHGVSCAPDGCALSATVGAANFDATLGLLAETAISPRLTPYDFSIVRERWMYNFVSSQRSAKLSLGRNAAALLFGRSHPYGFSIFPSTHTRDLTVKEVAALHARLFRPAHAVLVVVGDATKEAVSASATKWLGAWSSDSPPLPRPALQPPEPAQRQVVIVNQRDRVQCSVWVAVTVPTTDEAELAAVAVLARALGGLSSTLREEVRDESGAAYAFNDINQQFRGITVAGFSGELARAKTHDALKAVLVAVRKASATGVAAADVALAQTNLVAEWQARASTLEGLSRLTAEALERGVAPSTLAAWPARLAAVTPAAVQRAARRYFTDASLRVIVVGDFRWVENLDDLGLGDYQLRDGFGDVAP